MAADAGGAHSLTAKHSRAVRLLMGGYQELTKHLERQRADETDSVVLPFWEIEELIGTTLPFAASSSSTLGWWANNGQSPQSVAWMNASWQVEAVDVERNRAMFVRKSSPRATPDLVKPHEIAIRPEDPMTGGYKALGRHLKIQSHDTVAVIIAFFGLEDLIGMALPPEARTAVDWWANTEGSPQSIVWMKVNWRVEAVDLERERVKFVPKSCATPELVQPHAIPIRPEDPNTTREALEDHLAKSLKRYQQEREATQRATRRHAKWEEGREGRLELLLMVAFPAIVLLVAAKSHASLGFALILAAGAFGIGYTTWWRWVSERRRN
ncbi:MAG: hypothetical protein WCF24_08170 [Acidimicrobiales bacterium]